MRLNLSYTQMINIRTHESDHEKHGTSYHYEVENRFQAKLLKVERNDSLSIVDIYTDVSDKHSSWAKDKIGSPSLNEVHLVTAQSWVESARNNFDSNAQNFYQVCTAAGLNCTRPLIKKHTTAYPEDQSKIRLTAIINGNIHDMLNILIELSSTRILQQWFSNVKTKLPQNMTILSQHQLSLMPHAQDFCERCQNLDRLCSLKMEPSLSQSNGHQNDVAIKGLPLTITNLQLNEMFKIYGIIIRAKILPPKQGFTSRMAFITFVDPRSALQEFNRSAEGSLRTSGRAPPLVMSSAAPKVVGSKAKIAMSIANSRNENAHQDTATTLPQPNSISYSRRAFFASGDLINGNSITPNQVNESNNGVAEAGDAAMASSSSSVPQTLCLLQ